MKYTAPASVAPGPSSDGMIRAAIAPTSRALVGSKCSYAVDEGEAAALCACCWAEAIAGHAATPIAPRIQSRRVNVVMVIRILHGRSSPSQPRQARGQSFGPVFARIHGPQAMGSITLANLQICRPM